jgi:hypothetical protein
MSVWGRDDLDPHEVDAEESFMRGYKIGWYAMDRSKRLVSGPYPDWKACLAAIRGGLDPSKDLSPAGKRAPPA